uniref:coiled-coil-helix-coiled-coil-helix domain containing 3b n=1 Tax=Centroberyx gerrardi TaxID=166262 RepID=UPI003AAC385E
MLFQSVESPAPCEPISFPTPPLAELTPPSVAPPPPPAEPIAAPPPAPTAPPAPEPIFEESPPPCHSMELVVLPTDPPVSEPIVEPVAPPPPDPAPPAEEPAVAPSLPPIVEVMIPVVSSVPPPAPASPEVVEEELRRKIKEELQRGLELEMSQKKQELQQQLEEVKAQARAQAKAAAQAQVDEQVKKTLEAEKAAHMENLKDAIMKERMKTEDERLMAQLYAHKLDETEKDLKKQDTLFREHVAKLEAKSAEFYKVTTENFQKGKEETHNRFARFDIKPVCGDLQSQILKCFRENTGKTLSCSAIASAYMQCVDNAKQNKLSTGG